jgi:hypothetical protein
LTVDAKRQEVGGSVDDAPESHAHAHAAQATDHDALAGETVIHGHEEIDDGEQRRDQIDAVSTEFA